MTLKLFVNPKSGHSHRALLFLSLLGLKFDLVEVNLATREHKSPDFLKMNAFGQLPVLLDGDVAIPDSNAIMIYAARKSGRTDWYPEDPLEMARVQRWLSVAAGQLVNGPASARLVTLFGAKLDTEQVIAKAHALLTIIESELETRSWIAGKTATIADIALYSYIARAPEGNVDLADYLRIRKWLEQIESLRGFVPFKISPVGLYAPGAALAHLADA